MTTVIPFQSKTLRDALTRAEHPLRAVIGPINDGHIAIILDASDTVISCGVENTQMEAAIWAARCLHNFRNGLSEPLDRTDRALISGGQK